jgi:choline dehydrogenase-like flavoprotein
LPQNVQNCERHGHEHCGFCLFGCRYGYKRDVGETYLRRARDGGARVYSNTRVRRLHCSGGEVSYAEAVVAPDGERPRTVILRARRYVVAAGALHTPALLLGSGFSHPEIGRNLYIHPVFLMLGRYPNRMETWRGGMMTSSCDAAENLDGRHYGCKIETAPLHSGLLAILLPWRSGSDHKRAMLDAPFYAAFAVITRDRFGGCVSIDRDCHPRVRYILNTYDKGHAIQGMAMAAAIHAAAGASMVLPTHNDGITLDPAVHGAGAGAYRRVLESLDWAPHRAPVFSAHLMGTCRMGGNRKASPIAPDGRVVGCRNLYVTDGSVFPSASGINPMITIQALAYHTAECLAGELC